MEHQIYRVIRHPLRGAFKLTLKDYPAVNVLGKSRDLAEKALLDKIAAKFGDGEPVLDYLEDSEANGSSIRWVFRSNEKVATRNLDELFSNGLCVRCGIGQGARKVGIVRRVIGKIRGDVAFTFSGPILTHVFSSAMADVLIETGLNRADLAPVVDERGETYFEVLAKSAKIEWTPVRPILGVKVGAQKCPLCGFSSFGFVHIKDKDIRRFIDAADEARIGEATCIVGSNEPEPVLSNNAHTTIRKRKDLRGFIWGRVGLVKPSEVETKLKYDPFPKP